MKNNVSILCGGKQIIRSVGVAADDNRAPLVIKAIAHGRVNWLMVDQETGHGHGVVLPYNPRLKCLGGHRACGRRQQFYAMVRDPVPSIEPVCSIKALDDSGHTFRSVHIQTFLAAAYP